MSGASSFEFQLNRLARVISYCEKGFIYKQNEFTLCYSKLFLCCKHSSSSLINAKRNVT